MSEGTSSRPTDAVCDDYPSLVAQAPEMVAESLPDPKTRSFFRVVCNVREATPIATQHRA